MKRALFAIGLSISIAAFANSADAGPGARALKQHIGAVHEAKLRKVVVASIGKPATPAGTTVLKANPALWVVHGPKGTAYLLGSIHVLPKNVDWQTPRIVDAMKRADTFVFELRLDDDNRTDLRDMFARNGLLPINIALPSLFDEETREEYREAIVDTHTDPTFLVYMRPWLAALVLEGATSGGTDFVSSEGVDNKVYAYAKARGVKQFRAFETNELQMKVLMGIAAHGDEMQALKDTLKKIVAGEHQQSMHGLLDAWAKGDVKALASFGADNTDMSADDKKILLEDRNRSWIPQLRAMLNEKHTYFITVGAGHLVGPDGVPTLLRQAGYKVDGP